MGKTSFFLFPTIFLAALSATAAAAGNGWYLGADIGVALAQDVESTRINVGVPTNCDQWLGRATLNDGTSVPLPLEQCQPRELPGSPNDFDQKAGWLFGVNAGYAFGGLRLEAEYFHRRHGGEHLPLVVPGDPKQLEFTERSEEIDDIRGNHLFANLHYDLGVLKTSKLTPYVGVGLGLMRVEMDYSGTSIRNSDPQALLSLGRNPNAAGLISRADEKMKDNLFGFQLIAGLDYALGERHALSLKFRYANAFDDFADHDNSWKPLRDHASTVGPGGAPIRYGIEAGNLGFWTLSVGLKFFAN